MLGDPSIPYKLDHSAYDPMCLYNIYIENLIAKLCLIHLFY